MPHAYRDPRGFWTIGVGHLIDRPVGGTLDQLCINALLQQDVKIASDGAKEILGDTWASLNHVQQAVLTSMVFQMGAREINRWKLFLDALDLGRPDTAASLALRTLWARQTPERARRQMAMLSTGEWVDK